MKVIKKTKLFFIYIIISVIFLVGGIFFMPIWENTDVFWKDWGNKSIYLLIAILLLLYFIFYIIKYIKKNKSNTLYTLQIIEATLIGVLIVLCSINYFTNFMTSFFKTSKVLGTVLLIHGVIGLLSFYFGSRPSNKTYSLILYILYMLLLCFGSYFLTSNAIQDKYMIWLFAIILYVLFGVFLTIGLLAIPNKKSKKGANK